MPSPEFFFVITINRLYVRCEAQILNNYVKFIFSNNFLIGQSKIGLGNITEMFDRKWLRSIRR